MIRASAGRKARAARLVVPAFVVLAAAGCAAAGPTTTVRPEPTQPASAPATSASAPGELTPSPPLQTPAAETPGPETPEPTAPVPASPSEPAGPAAACTGSDANRTFFASVAAGVDWPVYCPVLPTGWFVESGSYRLSGGARLEIVYKGPSGARLELHEGAWCSGTDPCIPSGSDAGTTAFADREGALIGTEDGSWAVAVDDAGADGWLLVGSNLDEDAVRAIAAALATVGD